MVSRLLALLLGLLVLAPKSGDSLTIDGTAWRVAFLRVKGETAIACACYDGRIVCIDPAGKTLWSAQTGAFPYDLAAADLDGDGRDEVLVATAAGSVHAFGWNDKARERWVFRTQVPLPLYAVCAATVKEKPPRIFCGGPEGRLYELSADGARRATHDLAGPLRCLAAGDVTGDGTDEVVVGLMGVKRPIVVFGGTDRLEEVWSAATGARQAGEKAIGLYSLCAADFDGDGKAEVAFGSGFRTPGAGLVDSSGKLLWFERITTDRMTTSFVAATNADEKRGGLELAVLNGSQITILARDGTRLTEAAAPFGFTHLAASRSGAIVLGSRMEGDATVYRVQAASLGKELAALRPGPAFARIERTMDELRAQAAKVDAPVPPPGGLPPFRVRLGNARPGARVDALKTQLAARRQQFPYPNLVFYFSLLPPGKIERKGEKAEGTLVDTARELEKQGIAFSLVVGHGEDILVPLDEARAIAKAAPTCLLFFETSEQAFPGEGGRDALRKFMADYWLPLMDLCKEQGRQAELKEKNAWWAAVPSMKDFSGLIDPRRQGVLIASAEDSNGRCPELNLAGRVGLYLAGRASMKTVLIEDMYNWNRAFEYDYPTAGHPFVRTAVAQIVLGSSHLRVKGSVEGAGDDGASALDGVEAVLLHLIGKGILLPPTPAQMAGLSPVVFEMTEPHEMWKRDHLAQTDAEHLRGGSISPAEASRTAEYAGGLFIGAASWRGMSPPGPHSAMRLLLSQERHGLNFIPATPYGFFAIVPQGAATDRLPWVKRRIATDGVRVFDGSRALLGEEASRFVVNAFEEQAASMPFRAQGTVFLQAQIVSDGRWRLTLIDPGFLDPADREAVVRVQAPGATEAVDLIGGGRIPIKDGTLRLTVPAGSFRILEVCGR